MVAIATVVFLIGRNHHEAEDSKTVDLKVGHVFVVAHFKKAAEGIMGRVMSATARCPLQPGFPVRILGHSDKSAAFTYLGAAQGYLPSSATHGFLLSVEGGNLPCVTQVELTGDALKQVIEASAADWTSVNASSPGKPAP